MLNLLTLLAQATPVNPESVPGAVQLPLWLIVTAIVGLAGGIVGLFGILMKLAKDQRIAIEKKDEEHGKTLRNAEENHTKQIEEVTKRLKEEHQRDAAFWQKLVETKDKELANVGAKLDERHDESIELMKETGQSLKVVDLVIQELRKTQRGG